MSRNSLGFSTAYIGSVPDGTTPPTGAEAYNPVFATVEPYVSEGSIPGGVNPPNRCMLAGVEVLMKGAGPITDTSLMIHVAKGSHGEYELWSGSVTINSLPGAADGFYYASARKTFDPMIPYVNTETAPEAAPSRGPGALDTNRLYAYVYGSVTGGYPANIQVYWEADMDYHI